MFPCPGVTQVIEFSKILEKTSLGMMSLAHAAPWKIDQSCNHMVVCKQNAASISESRPREAAWLPMPSGRQVWAHSCCSREKLNAALADKRVTAVEVDIRMGTMINETSLVPICAHPPFKTSDLTVQDFLETCLRDGRRHIKLDFKDLESVHECLPLLVAVRPSLLANGQAVWINADILPGPGCRSWKWEIPPNDLFAAVAQHCPGVPLSLGWKANPVSRDTYTKADSVRMADLCRKYSHLLGGGVVFAVSARLADRAPAPLVGLLHDVPGSCLLLWTGSWEPPVRRAILDRLQRIFKQAEVSHRCDYDCRVFQPPALLETLAEIVRPVHLAAMIAWALKAHRQAYCGAVITSAVKSDDVFSYSGLVASKQAGASDGLLIGSRWFLVFALGYAKSTMCRL